MGVHAGIGSVFLGAMLAFLVDNMRERRMLRDWTARYLTAVGEGLAATSSALPEVRNATESSANELALQNLHAALVLPV